MNASWRLALERLNNWHLVSLVPQMPPNQSYSQLVDAPLESVPEAAQSEKAEKSTYGHILKSTALVGGSSVLNLVIGMVRAKSMAILLGPAGFGLLAGTELSNRLLGARHGDGGRRPHVKVKG